MTRHLKGPAELSNAHLLEIIHAQAGIAKAGLDLGQVMERAAALAQEITRAGGAVVELAEDDAMVYRACSGMAAPFLGLRLAREGSLSGLAVHSGEALYCLDSEADPRVDKDACRTSGLRSMLVMPLQHQGRLVGVLKVMHAAQDHFARRDLMALDLVSEVIAAAMSHATQFAGHLEHSRDLFFRATHDALTGLGNRSLFYDRLRQGLAGARRSGQALGVALLDMDGLKGINDRFGHHAGDAAIRTLADRLRRVSRESDTVARLGGDEFGIVLTQVPDASAAGTAGAHIAQEVEGPFEFESTTFHLRASVGVAVFPGDGERPDDLVQSADRAMYRMKTGRRTAGSAAGWGPR